MEFEHAITRLPAITAGQGITTACLGEPDLSLMIRQHQAYTSTLDSIGLTVEILPPLSRFPDAQFVEDTAVVAPGFAVITNPGAPSRQGEQDHIENILESVRPIARIQPPGTMDGGDVLQIDSTFLVGISQRTNSQGAHQFSEIVEKYGFQCIVVPIEDGLHLKSGINAIGNGTMVMTRQFDALAEFADWNRIVISDEEQYAANVLRVNNHLIMPAGFPSTRAQLAAIGINLIELEMSEFQKMDGGLTCLSLRF